MLLTIWRSISPAVSKVLLFETKESILNVYKPYADFSCHEPKCCVKNIKTRDVSTNEVTRPRMKWQIHECGIAFHATKQLSSQQGRSGENLVEIR